MSKQAAPAAPLLLVLGEEELLVERAVRAASDAAKALDPMTETVRIKAAELTVPRFAELVSPSLFGEGRVVVVDTAQDAGAELAEALVAYRPQPDDGIVLVVVHSGGGRAKLAKQLPAALKGNGAAVEECGKITRSNEREAFVRNEVRRVGGRIDARAVSALVETVGSDLRELAAAAVQLVADTDGPIDETVVRRYHRGRAEVTGFAVAEKAVTGDRTGALEALRWALQTGVPAVLIADALADAVRSIALVRGARNGDPMQMAGELGMPPWKIKKVRTQVRGWEEAGLGRAMHLVAALNGEVKGMAADSSYALERAVFGIIDARSAAH
ncbi:DNA polymerase III subunit delta [Actinoalloteichus hymeniacidonis]|uniref:DNA-directed DNA polymerase n=1 Tax=Actinoalloteichus hymeniacidonis TaxID=340345 RepID=A0AAC9HNN8_9PSEU|nr:DNA polymerase III subunit delta [Actinoalloteichus hymeniacidonis]AOS62468.1 DNA polymerase III, delta subunit [Actinoalloteichus hymeniacidonis]MBB5909501.1 DNA polymerase-3 subunit delta [Actinoalloteichus hymeniacidonis]